MKNGKKVLITASIFTVAMNMNGCGVYGPPQDERYPLPTATTKLEVPTPTPGVTSNPTESEDWYALTWGRYAVVRLVSIPKLENIAKGERIGCPIEMLSYYDADGEDLSAVTELFVWQEDLSLFSEGDILFVDLGRTKTSDGQIRYVISGVSGRPDFTPFVDDSLVLTEAFKQDYLYGLLCDYGAMVERYWTAAKEGEDFFIKSEPQYFFEGMTSDEVSQLFTSFANVKADFEAYLDEMESKKIK